MKRTRIVGLCLAAALAVVAFSAMAASSASAGTYYWCTAQKHGNFTESGCKTVAEKKGKPDHKGGWELTPVAACVAQKHGNFTESGCKTVAEKKGKPDHKGGWELSKGRKFTDTTGSAKLATPDLGPNDVECTASTSSGEITSSTTGTDEVSFTNCTLEGKKCESVDFFGGGTPSGTPGVIDTNKLDTKLIDHGTQAGGYLKEEPALNEVWTEVISSEKEPYSSEFICGGEIILRTHGSVSGVDTPVNAAPSTSSTTTFAVGEGEQALLTEVFNGAEFIPSGGAPSSEETTSSLHNEVAIEIKS
ncbi:MAG: hypothetical protein ACLQBY_08820 [Solirubrobacteraceae bacterium]